VAHELVVVVELVVLDPDDRAVVGNADQQISAFGVQERGDRSIACSKERSEISGLMPSVQSERPAFSSCQPTHLPARK
jgi:hypothetical protein